MSLYFLENQIDHSVSKLNLKLVIGLLLSTSLTVAHAENLLIENPPKESQYISDSWVVKYQANDFTDEISNATVLYIPKNYGKEAAIQLRCKPFFTNFSLQYTEQEKNLLDDGKLPNASAKFAKHGYIYDDKQSLKVTVKDNYENYNVSVGGQNKHLTNLFKTEKKIQPGLLGMSFFYSFTFKEMPSFRPGETPDDAKDFFKQINQAVKNGQTVKFTLESKQDLVRKFEWNTQRMNDFVPQEVMDFCLTNRKLK